jgi:hypothetical protein
MCGSETVGVLVRLSVDDTEGHRRQFQLAPSVEAADDTEVSAGNGAAAVQ